jgi:hypothetical protein
MVELLRDVEQQADGDQLPMVALARDTVQAPTP